MVEKKKLPVYDLQRASCRSSLPPIRRDCRMQLGELTPFMTSFSTSGFSDFPGLNPFK